MRGLIASHDLRRPLELAALVAALAGCGSDDPADGTGSGSGASAGTGAAGQAQAGTGGSASGASGAAGSGAASGSGGTASGAAAGSTAGGVCLPPLARCAADGECCDGAICLNSECRPTCQVRNDCGSLCCQEDPAAGRKLCVAASLCEGSGDCATEGNACTDSPCCDTMICVESTVPSWSGCRPPCQTDGECESDCCLPFANTPSGFCAEPRFCTCAHLDEECGGAIQCCDGLACASTSEAGVYACRPVCTADADCSGGGCCVPLGSTGTKVCMGSSCP
jgi:hypothetical protein